MQGEVVLLEYVKETWMMEAPTETSRLADARSAISKLGNGYINHLKAGL
jgi:hypothetical protein